MLLVGLVLISMAGVLIVGASGQVQGLDQAQTMIAHGPVLASNQTELVDLIGVNGLPSDSSSQDHHSCIYLKINATNPTNPISIGNTSSYLIITNSNMANTYICSIGYNGGANLFLSNMGTVLI